MMDILLTGTDLSRSVATPIGKPVGVVLEDISTTGYRWTPAVDPAAAANVADEGVAPGGAPGASGRRRFTVVPRIRGRIVVRFRLQRPWDTAAAPEREAIVTLDVE